MFTSATVVFYCHFPDMLLAKHDSFLRVIYRSPLDWLEEVTTGMVRFLGSRARSFLLPESATLI